MAVNHPKPDWLRYLNLLAERLVLRPLEPSRRVLLGLPTADAAAAILARSATAALANHRRDNPLDRLTASDVGCRVSTYQDGAFEDRVLTEAADNGVRTGLITQRDFADIVRRLPNGFPEQRRRRKIPPAVEAAWMPVDPDVARRHRIYARVAATPVVLIANKKKITDDLRVIDAYWPTASEFVDLGYLDNWFRHPAIVCDPQTKPPPWLCETHPSLVICDGVAAWRSLLRRKFPSAPHLLVLGRRAEASVELVEDIRTGNPETFSIPWSPPAGIEAWGIVEHLRADSGNSDDEDLF